MKTTFVKSNYIHVNLIWFVFIENSFILSNASKYLTNQEVDILLESSFSFDDDTTLDNILAETVDEENKIHEK